MSTLLNNRYELLERIGDGGMAEVYRAHDIQLDRFVAVKILHPQFTNDESFVERFRREAKGAARLSHPNIVNIYDVGCSDGRYYIVMEYIKGETLKEKIKREAPLPVAEALQIMEEIAEALQNAHANHLVHCDIKPHNILISEEGHVKVADFGIARATTSSTVTYTSSVVGSVHYFSPEQAKGETISPKSDIYSLGVVMYEMLTGDVPFKGETAVSIAIKQIQETPIPPHELRPDIPPLVEAIVLRAMDKDPAKRFTSTELIREIEIAKARPFTQPASMPASDPFATRVLTNEEMQQLQNAKAKPQPAAAPAAPQDYEQEPEEESSSGFFSKKFLFTLVGILILGLCLGAFLSYGDFWSTKTVTVPNVVGMSQAQAEETLKAENLRVEVAETFDETVEAGKVASQTPEAGKTVKENRLVTIYISKGGEEITMPDLTGMSQQDAEEQLSKLKLKVGKLVLEYSDQPKGTVLKQSIAANSKTTKGTSVDLVISKGKEISKVTVPDVRGQSVENAKAILSGVGLKVSASASSGQVTAQSIPSGSQVDSGSSIELTVSDRASSVHSDRNDNAGASEGNKNNNDSTGGQSNSQPAQQVPQRERN